MTITPELIDIWLETPSENRDLVLARLRNVVRVVLRKYGYPQGLRESVVEQVLELAKQTEGNPAP